MRSCRIEEEFTWVKTFGKEVEEYVTKVIAKDGIVTRFGGQFPHFIEEEEEKKPKPYNLYGFVDLMENEQVYANTGFAPHRIPQSEGNHNGMAECFLGKMPPCRATGEDENPPDIATLLAQKGGGVVLTRWMERMETVIDNSGCAENQKVRYVASSLVNKALTWWNTQVQARGREVTNVCKDYVVYGWIGTEIRGMLRQLNQATIQVQFARPDHFARDCRSPAIPAAPVNALMQGLTNEHFSFGMASLEGAGGEESLEE
ncbi:hypothetical protein Tco_0617346 [Tanacetum coccineum]